MYDLADNLLGERSPQNDIDAHLPLAPIADNWQAHCRGPQGEFEAQYHYDALGRCRSSVTTAAAAAGATIRPARGARWRRWSRRATAARRIFTGITPI